MKFTCEYDFPSGGFIVTIAGNRSQALSEAKLVAVLSYWSRQLQSIPESQRTDNTAWHAFRTATVAKEPKRPAPPAISLDDLITKLKRNIP